MAADNLDFFSGGVPAGAIFQLSSQELMKLLAIKRDKAIGNTQEELCFIGLVSFFEAFCRDCFASVINICPMLLQRLKAKSYDVAIDSLAALEMHDAFRYNVGFLVAERFDFGNARKINALYLTLIGITPFSKDEVKVFDDTLSDRNLLVHHGGVFTHSYFRQHAGLESESKRPFWDSLVINSDYVTSRFDFLYGMAEKIVNACHAAMIKQIASGELTLDASAEEALRMLNWWNRS